MKYKAVKSTLVYPDGFTAFNLVEGQEVELSKDQAAFCLERGLIAEDKPKVETKPLEIEDKEIKPLARKKAVKK